MKILGPDKALLGKDITYSVDVASYTSIEWYKDGNKISLLPNEDPMHLNLYDIGYMASGTYWAIVDGTKSNEIILSVVEKLAEQYCYIHPIPWRRCGYIWIGWWVFDEIVEANADGFDWMSDPMNERFKYPKDISTLAWGFENYGDLEVQESRNGYIYCRDELVKLA